MEKEPKIDELEKICKHAELWERRRGDAIICNKGHGHYGSEATCICTEFFSTGHLEEGAVYDLKKIFDCSYRNCGYSWKELREVFPELYKKADTK